MIIEIYQRVMNYTREISITMINEDVMQVSDDDEELFSDDPKRGARTLNSNWTYSGSNILFREQIYQDDNEIDDSDIDEVTISEEEMNAPVDPQGKDIIRTTAEEFHGTTSARHTSHRFIDTETILIKSKYIMAEIIETNERTLDGEIHTHWNKKKVWNIQTELGGDEIVDAQTGTETDVFLGMLRPSARRPSARRPSAQETECPED